MIPSKRKSVSRNFESSKIKTSKDSTTPVLIDGKVFENWLREDVQFRYSDNSKSINKVRESKGSFNNTSSSVSKDFVSSRSLSSRTDSSLSSLEHINFPLASEHDVALVSQPEFRLLFEKLLLHTHSKQRVELIRNILICSKKSACLPGLTPNEKIASHSKFYGLAEKLEGSKLQLRHHMTLKSERLAKINDINKRCCELEKKRSELLYKIQEAKQKITLKQNFSETVENYILPVFDPGYYTDFQNVVESYLNQYGTTSGYNLVQNPQSLRKEVHQLLSEATEIAQNSFNSIADSSSSDNGPDYTQIISRLRPLIINYTNKQFYKELALSNKTTKSDLYNEFQSFPSKDTPFCFKTVATYQDLTKQLFDCIPYPGFSTSDYLLTVRKSLFLKQLELKEILIQINSTDRSFEAELDFQEQQSQTAFSQEKASLLRQILQLKAQIFGFECGSKNLKTQSFPSVQLSSFNSSLLGKLEEKMTSCQTLMDTTCKGIQVLFRTFQLQSTHTLPSQNFNETQLFSNLEKYYKCSKVWIDSETQCFNDFDLKLIVKAGKDFAKNPALEMIAKCDRKDLKYSFDALSTDPVLMLPPINNLKTLQPCVWYKTPDWSFPEIMEIKISKKRLARLIIESEKSAQSHFSAWGQSLTEWNYNVQLALANSPSETSCLSQDVHEDLKNLLYQVYYRWDTSKKRDKSNLNFACEKLIPVIQEQCLDIYNCFQERDDLSKEFPI